MNENEQTIFKTKKHFGLLTGLKFTDVRCKNGLLTRRPSINVSVEQLDANLNKTVMSNQIVQLEEAMDTTMILEKPVFIHANEWCTISYGDFYGEAEFYSQTLFLPQFRFCRNVDWEYRLEHETRL